MHQWSKQTVRFKTESGRDEVCPGHWKEQKQVSKGGVCQYRLEGRDLQKQKQTKGERSLDHGKSHPSQGSSLLQSQAGCKRGKGNIGMDK